MSSRSGGGGSTEIVKEVVVAAVAKVAKKATKATAAKEVAVTMVAK
jgi:hypothetical protein